LKPTRMVSEPDTRIKSEFHEARFIKSACENAAFQYDAFIAKLDKKIGEAVSAELSGNHVWSFSVLTVEKADGSIEHWKTQMIINFSKLGKMFNQFPTRKIKIKIKK